MRLPVPSLRIPWRRRTHTPEIPAHTATARGMGQTHLLMVQVGDRPTWWEVTETGSRRLDTAPLEPLKTVFRAAPYDRSLAAGRLTGAKRDRLLIQELGERGIAFRDGEITYFAPESDATCGPGRRTVPLTTLIVRDRVRAHRPLPDGVVIRLGDDNEGLAIAWTMGLDGCPAGFAASVVLDEDGLREVARESADQIGIANVNAATMMTHADLWRMLTARRLPSYPVPGTVAGIPTETWRAGVLVVSAVAATLAGLDMGTADQAMTHARAQLTMVRATQTTQAAERRFDRRHLIGIARAASITYRADLQAAQKLWRPGAAITLQAGPSATKADGPLYHPQQATLIVRARMHHLHGQQIGASGSWPSIALRAILAARAPSGFILHKILINPHGTRYEAIYIRH